MQACCPVAYRSILFPSTQHDRSIHVISRMLDASVPTVRSRLDGIFLGSGRKTPSAASPFPVHSIHRIFFPSPSCLLLPTTHVFRSIGMRLDPFHRGPSTNPVVVVVVFPAIAAPPRPRLVLIRGMVGQESTVRFFPWLCPVSRGSNPGLPGWTFGSNHGSRPTAPLDGDLEASHR